MILGIGTDVIKVDRIAGVLSRHRDRFLLRVLHPMERDMLFAECRNDSELTRFVAKKFAAKEAVSKAIGCAIGKDLALNDIIIFNNQFGKPFVKKTVRLTDAVRKFTHVASFVIHVSISDEQDIAMAVAILEDVPHTVQDMDLA